MARGVLRRACLGTFSAARCAAQSFNPPLAPLCSPACPPCRPQVSAIREQLAALYEAQEEWSKAAHALAGIDLDSGMRLLDAGGTRARRPCHAATLPACLRARHRPRHVDAAAGAPCARRRSSPSGLVCVVQSSGALPVPTVWPHRARLRNPLPTVYRNIDCSVTPCAGPPLLQSTSWARTSRSPCCTWRTTTQWRRRPTSKRPPPCSPPARCGPPRPPALDVTASLKVAAQQGHGGSNGGSRSRAATNCDPAAICRSCASPPPTASASTWPPMTKGEGA